MPLTPEEIAAKEAEDALKKAEEDAKALSDAQKAGNQELIDKLVADKVAEQVASLKTKLDSAYEARDKALQEAAILRQKEKEAELERLKADGKHKEAYELQLAEERATNEALKKRNTELTRDVNVRDAMKAYSFRSDKAAEMAFHEVANQLTQDEKGVWVHRSGISISDFVKLFAENKDNAFLFKTKANTGGGSSESGDGSLDNTQKPTSLFKLSQKEVLEMAEKGQIKRK